MKILKNKILLNLFIVIMMVTMASMSYSTYFSYQSYLEVKNSTKLSPFLNEVESILDKIESERINSVTYLVTQEKNNFKKLQETRVMVDSALAGLEVFVKHNSEYAICAKQIKLAEGELNYVRSEVDNLSDDYRNILFHTFHNKIFGLFLEMIEDVSSIQRSELLKSYLSMYEEYTKIKENSVVENTYIYYFLLRSKTMSDEDITLWKELIVKDNLSELDSLINKILTVNVDELLSVEEFDAIISIEREMILAEARRGKYAVSVAGWLNKTKKKFDYFAQVRSALLTEIKNVEQEYIAQSRNLILWYGMGALALLFLLHRLFFIYYRLDTNKELTEDTLKDLALIFDKNQQKEIERLLDTGKIDHIYKFMIQAIKDANQTKDLFLASMSHEIRTPLNGILGFTQLLKEADSKEEREDFIAVIEKSGVNLLTIVNDILDLSKIKAQKIDLESIEFDPVDSFEAAVESYAAKASEEDIDFNIFLDPQLPTLLKGDPTKISQIIVNLISNAIKFTPKNGEVNVNIEKLSESLDEVEVKFSVSDTGIGITKEQKENIFEAFSQADVSTSRKYGGTGLGLSISGKLVELMGGKLNIKSVQNEGSTFYFTLVLKKPENARRREVVDMSSYTVGILSSHIDTKYSINKNLEAYINYTGAKIKRYTDESLLAAKGRSILPDILFIDHKFRCRGDEIEPFLDIDTKIVLMSTGNQKRNLKRYKSRINRILYKPINFTKTLKILIGKEELLEDKTKITFENVHVLVAEDNIINQKLILHVLTRLGVEVSIVNNGEEALNARIENEYDMIFMDIEMPVMGGMEATGKIFNYEKSNNKIHIPIVALTANTLSGDKEMYMAAGMDSYLSKPIELEKLKLLLQDYFEDRIVEDDA